MEMFNFNILLMFVVSSFFLCVTPGPATLYVLSRSVGQGRAAGVYSALGLAMGNLFHAAAAGLGLSIVLVYSPVAFFCVKIFGACYLLYLGILMLFSEENALRPATVSKNSIAGEIFRQGFMIEILNPNAALFFLSFLPQFVDSSKGSPALQLFVLGCIFLFTALPVDLFIAFMGGRVATYLMHYPMMGRVQHWLTSTVLIGLGLRLAFSKLG